MVTGDTKAPYIRRSRLEMKASILKAIMSEPVTPTKLITLTNSTHSTLKKYLPDLERRGLVRIQHYIMHHRPRGPGRPYRSLIHITAKGRKVLSEYESIANKLMNSICRQKRTSN